MKLSIFATIGATVGDLTEGVFETRFDVCNVVALAGTEPHLFEEIKEVFRKEPIRFTRLETANTFVWGATGKEVELEKGAGFGFGYKNTDILVFKARLHFSNILYTKF